MKATLLDLDIDISFRLVHRKGTEVNLTVSGVPASFDAVLKTVPGTNDVHIRLIPVLATNLFCAVHYFDDTRQNATLADRTTGVSADVFIGVQFVVQPEDADRDLLIDIHDQAATVRKRIAPPNEYLPNSGC
jgi:hypothetical protein